MSSPDFTRRIRNRHQPTAATFGKLIRAQDQRNCWTLRGFRSLADDILQSKRHSSSNYFVPTNNAQQWITKSCDDSLTVLGLLFALSSRPFFTDLEDFCFLLCLIASRR